ncbi:MAG TPA: prepilin-type N-terminal cleavage/methylation domain-containing protein [Kofleriaceae bacterium]|nr:prepilin-type N-terminal cleavage/methylation domain-containing protein [Kofleriaceae bacterium]
MTRTRRPPEAGFTMIEVLVAIVLCSIAVVGISALARVQSNAAGFSRRSTEASILAEDQFERLRLTASPTIASTGSQTGLDENGVVSNKGVFTRSWTVTPNGTYADVAVTVSWDDGVTRKVVLRGRRTR